MVISSCCCACFGFVGATLGVWCGVLTCWCPGVVDYSD